MIRIQPGEAVLAPDGKVIKAAEYQAVLDADRLLAEARAEADRLRAEAEAEFRRRSEEGYQEGLRRGQQELSEQMLELVMRGLEFTRGLESRVAELVAIALELVVGEMDSRELLHRVVRQALMAVQDAKQVTLRVNPTRAPSLERWLAANDTPRLRMLSVKVVPDTRMKELDCILETELGAVDASLGVQLEAIRSVLSRVAGAAGGGDGRVPETFGAVPR